MANKDRDPHAGRLYGDILVEYLARFHRHLPFFLGRAVIHEDVDMRDHVEGDLLGELLVLFRVVHKNAAGLVKQFVHCRLAGAGGRLIGRYRHALDLRFIVQRLQRDDHLDRGTVGVSNDVALGVPIEVFRIDLGYDQRHIRIHSEIRRIVDHDTTRLGSPGRMFGGRLGAWRKQRDIGIRKIIMLEILHRQDVVVSERDLPPDGARRCQRDHVIGGEVSLRQNFQHLAADISRRSSNGNFVTHVSFFHLMRLPGRGCLTDRLADQNRPRRQKSTLRSRARVVRILLHGAPPSSGGHQLSGLVILTMVLAVGFVVAFPVPKVMVGFPSGRSAGSRSRNRLLPQKRRWRRCTDRQRPAT